MTRDERQAITIDRWKESKGNGIVLAATGFGKTFIALSIVKRLIVQKSNVKAIIVVPTSYLQGQWLMSASRMGVINNVEVLVINTASKYEKTCDLLIVDECHMSVSDIYINLYRVITHTMFLGLTATLERLDGLETRLLEKAPIIDEITLEEAISNGWVAPYKQYKVLINVDLTTYEEHNATFLHHFAFFDFNFNLAMNCLSDSALRAKIANMMGTSARDVMIHAANFNRAMQARKSFINEHLAKIDIANKIINARPEAKMITFTKQVSHAEMLCCGDIYHGKLKKKEKDLMMKKFIKAETGVIHSCKAFDVGTDLPGVDTVIILSGDSSNATKKQRVGRCVRYAPGRVGEVWDLIIKGTVEEKWFEKANGNLDYEVVQDYQLDDLLNGNELKESDTEFKLTL